MNRRDFFRGAGVLVAAPFVPAKQAVSKIAVTPMTNDFWTFYPGDDAPLRHVWEATVLGGTEMTERFVWVEDELKPARPC